MGGDSPAYHLIDRGLPKTDNGVIDYTEVRRLYNIPLVDSNKVSGKDVLDEKRELARDLVKRKIKMKNEVS